MREVRFDPSLEIPEVEILVCGPDKSARARVVFDTGAGLTQLDVDLLENTGFSARDAVGLSSVKGAAGSEIVHGYIVELPRLFVFGIELRNVQVLAYDFQNFPGIEGLLGFDVIKRFHLEMNGPDGLLRVF